MVTYDFYKNTYLGSALTEAAFKQAAARAEEWLSKLEHTCSVTASGPDSRCLAVCAMAEALAAWEKRSGIAQTSIGGVTVRYEKSGSGLQQQLLRAALTYLDICRGVGG